MGDWLLDPATGRWKHFPDLPTPQPPPPRPALDGDPALAQLGPVDWTVNAQDPVLDPAWPRITEASDVDPPDRFPENWGAEPTERDQAAIDAGNA